MHARQPRSAPLAGAAQATPSAAAPPSIAVLPFADMSAAKDQEYFSDGISEEILNALVQVEGLKVTGRTSSFSFKGKNEDLRGIGEKLGVAHVLEGSVRKEGSHVRVTAQLINVADGYHLWSKTWDRELTSIFAVQDEIARAVVENLQVKLLPGKGPGSSRPTTPEAYAQFLIGMQAWRNGATSEALLPIWEKVTSLDPTYAPGWAFAAGALIWAAPKGETPAARDARSERALGTAEKAVALDPSSADAYAARGVVRMELWDWKGAGVDLDRALALAPGSAHVVRWRGHLLRATGRRQEAFLAYRRAAELDPLAAPNWGFLGGAYLDNGDPREARSAFQRAARLGPSSDDNTRLGLFWSFLLEGQLDQASSLLEQLTDEDNRLAATSALAQARGDERGAREALDRLAARVGSSDPYTLAELHARRGELDRAFEWLDKSFALRHHDLAELKLDWMVARLRGDPRYRELLEKMKLPLD